MEFAGNVNLVYIDPLFDAGADFSFGMAVASGPNGDAGAVEFRKLPSILEQKAYRDTRGAGSIPLWNGLTSCGKLSPHRFGANTLQIMPK